MGKYWLAMSPGVIDPDAKTPRVLLPVVLSIVLHSLQRIPGRKLMGATPRRESLHEWNLFPLSKGLIWGGTSEVFTPCSPSPFSEVNPHTESP